MKPKPQIVELLARRIKAPGEPGAWKKFKTGTAGGGAVASNPLAHYDFTLHLDNGAVYQIGRVTNNPPGVEWFQLDMEKRPQRYTKVR